MAIKLYGVPYSQCTKRVGLVLHEKDLPYEMVLVDVHNKEQKSPEYLKIQPFGQIPYIDDNGFIVYESRAICRYLAVKYASQGNSLIPSTSDLQAYARFEQAASTETANFDPYAGTLFHENIVKPMFDKPKDEGKTEEALKTLIDKLDGYEAILSQQKCLAGEEITLADLFHLPFGTAISKVGLHVFESDDRPNVARWWKDLISRPAWKAVMDGA